MGPYGIQRGIDVWVNGGRCRMQIMFWLVMSVAFLSLPEIRLEARRPLAVPVLRAESQPRWARAHAGQSTGAEKPEGRGTVTPGMGKEAVRHIWGAPEAVRKIRTCFGWQEEWVYRGDPQRFGASERVLLFDEGEVLTEIK